MTLKDKVALVTGTSPNIGGGIAEGLAAAGAAIVAVDSRAENAGDCARYVNQTGGRAIGITADVTDEAQVEKAVADAVVAFGRIDILVNNAGGSRVLPIDAPEERWVEAMTLNFTRPRQLTHVLLPKMIENRWGRVINITGKSEPDHLNAAFSAKAGIHAWAKGLSREVGQFGITVNSIAPGRIMSEQIRRNYPEDFRKQFAATEIPVRYWGEPKDLAVMAVWLASPLARYITGTVIPVDGGLRRYQF
jgi:3-oxoacyl-[acyl-carrier protein] reductase